MSVEAEPSCALGEAIRECRIESGLSQEELAGEAQVSEKDIAAWESGRGDEPGLSIVRSVAHALDMSTSDLVQAAECN